jgi:hypothetical protein
VINPAFETFAEHFSIEGLLGVRAITHYARRFFSPVYGYCEWKRGAQTANCAIGCATVPGERHQGCGFHAFWEAQAARLFVEHIRGTETCLVLIECFGRVVIHERGLRAERARIIAAVDWDPRVMFGAWPMLSGHRELSMPVAAARAFDVSLIDESAAESLIQSQREMVVAA